MSTQAEQLPPGQSGSAASWPQNRDRNQGGVSAPDSTMKVRPADFSSFILLLAIIFPHHAVAQDPRPDICHAAGRLPAGDSKDRQLVDLTCRVLRAINEGERTTLADLMASDFSMTTVSGKFLPESKQSMLDRWIPRKDSQEAGSSLLIEVRRSTVLSSSGFITGVVQDRERKGEREECTIHAFTDLWEKRRSRWVWIHSHESGLSRVPCR